MKFWSRLPSLQHKIITAIVMVGLLPLSLSLVLTYLEERRALRETVGANFKEVAVEAARRIEMHITRGINEAQQLAATPFLRTAVVEANRSYEGKEPERIQSMIRDWQRRWRERESQHEFPLFINRIVTNYLIRWHEIRKADYVGILVTDNQGALVLSSIPQVEYYYGKSPWWKAVYNETKGQVYISDVYFDPSFGTRVLNVSVPIRGEDSQGAIGAISILLKQDTIFHSISEATVGATGHAMLFNSEGTPLMCPVLAPEEHAITSALASFGTSPNGGWIEAEHDSHGHQHALVGFAPVRIGESLAPESFGGQKWFTLVRQDPSETFAPLQQLVIMVAGYGVLVFAVLWGIGVLVARKIVQPIELLQEGAQRIGSGELTHQLTVHTGDEIEQLASAFNAMAFNLQNSFGELEQRMFEIRQLEEKYRDLIENSPEMIHQLNQEGQFVHVNKTELEKLGYTLDDMLTMHLWDIVPEEQVSEIHAYLERLLAQGRAKIETVFVTREGQSIDVEMHSTALFDQSTGGLVYSRGFVRDMTQRKALEKKVQRYTTQLEQDVTVRTQELLTSQQRYKALFDLVADSVFMVSREGHVIAVNKREEQALGYLERSVIGKPFLDIVDPQHRGDVAQLLANIFQGESRVPTQEVQVFRGTGEPTIVEMDLIRIEDGAVPSVLVQLRDIAERKQLEQQLQEYREGLEQKVQARTREIEETKQYLENLLENANDVIYTLDTNQCFTYVNSQIGSWGYQKEDLIGRPYLSLLSKRHRGRRLKSTLDIGTKQVYEVEVLSKDGEPRAVMMSVSPLYNAEGLILGVLGIAHDVTDTKRMEQQIRNSEKLASVGKLAAGVAHEINNPLGGILNCLYNLEKGTLSPEREQEYLGSMEDGLRRVQKIVRQLLDFSQQHAPEFSSTDVNGMVEQVLVLTNHVFTANQVTLHKQLGSDLPALMVDRHMIEQVLMNLLLNAVQSLREQGTITIRTREMDGVCSLEIEDNGCGIPTTVLPHIFDPFFTTKGTGEGTGLGLSVSLGIIERHGGRILVNSEVGRGTVFTVCLPVTQDRQAVERA